MKHTIRKLILVIIATLGLGGLGVLSAAWVWERAYPDTHEFLYIIPKGTAYLQATGQETSMLPKLIIFTVGDLDTLVIHNDDDFPANIGPFKLETGRQYRQRFRSIGELQMLCSTIYHKEQVEIRVQPARNNLWAQLRLWVRA